jgi:hypothetical protein
VSSTRPRERELALPSFLSQRRRYLTTRKKIIALWQWKKTARLGREKRQFASGEPQMSGRDSSSKERETSFFQCEKERKIRQMIKKRNRYSHIRCIDYFALKQK